MTYPYPQHRIIELVQAPKIVRENEQFDVAAKGESGAVFAVNLDLLDGPFVDFRYLGKATDRAQPTSYDASLILASYRVRGVGHQNVGRHNFRAKLRVPPGWHQNICDPNLPTTHPEQNRHEALPGFAPTDFGNFISLCAQLWVIDLKEEGVLL